MEKSNTARAMFLRAAAEGDYSFDRPTIARLAGQVQVPLEDTEYYCIAVRFAGKELSLTDIQLPGQLLSACEEAAKRSKKDICCYVGAQLYTLLVVLDRPGKRQALISKLFRDISKRVSHPVQMGIGRSYDQLEKLNYSRVEAFEALGELSESEQISYIEDIYASRSITTRKLENQRRRIVELFKAGKLDQMTESMTQLAENVRSESPVREGTPYPTSIRRTILEVLFELMHIGADAGVDVDKLLDYQDPYNRVILIGDATPVLLNWFSDIAQKLYSAISERHSRTESNMLQLAKVSIDQYLSDPELSLSLVSETLEITPTYLSAFFIREMGVGFNEYVTALRTEKAKQLLTKTNKKINQIAAECGFRSASYFIVVFRKQVGMAPGEYRDMKK